MSQNALDRKNTNMPLSHGSGLSVFFLPSAFLFLSGSRFGATPHDDAHDAFMALPPYTRTREHDGQPVVSAAMRQPTQQMLTRRIRCHKNCCVMAYNRKAWKLGLDWL